MNYKGIALGILGFLFRLAILAVVIYYIYEFAFQAYNFGYEVFVDPPYALAPGRTITVTVSDPTDYKKMAQDFEKAGLIKDWKLFYVQIFFSEYKEDLQPGTFELNNSWTSQDMLYAMTPGTDEDGNADDVEGDVVDTAEDMTEVMTEEEMKDDSIYTGDVVDNAGDIAPEDVGEGEGGE